MTLHLIYLVQKNLEKSFVPIITNVYEKAHRWKTLRGTQSSSRMIESTN